MNEPHNKFRGQLLKAEQPNPTYKEKYEKEVRAMLEQKLTGFRRWKFIAFAAIGLGMTLLCAYGLFFVRWLNPVTAHFGLAAWGLFGLAGAVLAGRIACRGRFNLKADPLAIARMVWAFVFLMISFSLYVVFIEQGIDSLQVWDVLVFIYALAFFVGVSVDLIGRLIRRAELNTREKLLEIEYRLAELAEQMGKKHSE